MNGDQRREVMRSLVRAAAASLPGPRDVVDGFMCLATVVGLVLVLEWVLDTIRF
jgi:hypothetical protein